MTHSAIVALLASPGARTTRVRMEERLPSIHSVWWPAPGARGLWRPPGVGKGLVLASGWSALWIDDRCVREELGGGRGNVRVTDVCVSVGLLSSVEPPDPFRRVVLHGMQLC